MPTEMMECPVCGFEMQYVHEHDACKHCGLIIGCCEGTTIGVGEGLKAPTATSVAD